MRFALISRHLPEPEGTAAGRVLLATAEGLLAEGHAVTLRSWRPEPPTAELPEWCEWQPLPPEPAWRTRGRALLRPRADAVRAGWTPPGDAIAIAEEPVSHAAVADLPGSVTVLHYATALDVAGTPGRRWHPTDVQSWRAERRAVRSAGRGTGRVLAYSPRVARAFGEGPSFVPIALRIPEEALPLVERPVAALVADWRWPPNRAALSRLLTVWPTVREAVPDAQLHLAGRGDPEVGTLAGVRVLGAVARSIDVLSEAAVLAFPCPDTSGPKVKVLEAMAAGLPVVTTPAGVEGLRVPAGLIAGADGTEFGVALIGLLRDPVARAAACRSAREAVTAAHAPRPAARARAAACAPRDEG